MKSKFHNEAGVQAPSEGSFAGSSLGKRLIKLLDSGSASQKRIAEYALRNPLRLTAFSIEELSAATSASPATLSRFARESGFSSFAEFRNAVAETMQGLLDPLSKLADRLEGEGGTRSAAAESLETAKGHLGALSGGATEAAISGLVAEIRAARSVYVMGFGLSAHLAAMLTLGLQPYRPEVVNVVQFGGTEVAAGRLMAIGAGDLLIAISFPRYAGDAVQLSRYARDKGARVAAITDSAASPLSRYAQTVVFASAVHPVLSATMVPGLAVCEAVCAQFMLADRDNLEKAAELTRAISDYLYRT